MENVTHKYKDVKIQIQPRELRAGGWVVRIVLHHQDDQAGITYEVKTICASRLEAELSGLALAHGIIDKER